MQHTLRVRAEQHKQLPLPAASPPACSRRRRGRGGGGLGPRHRCSGLTGLCSGLFLCLRRLGRSGACGRRQGRRRLGLCRLLLWLLLQGLLLLRLLLCWLRLWHRLGLGSRRGNCRGTVWPMTTHFQTWRLHRAQPLQLGVLAGRVCKQRRRLLILEVGQISCVLWVAREL